MLGRVVVENGVKKIVPLTADCGSGNPVGTVIAVYSNKVPNGYLPCNGVAFDTAQFPVLYALLGDNHTPDLRECTLVGIGRSDRTMGNHDEYTVGQFKDDQSQKITGRYNATGAFDSLEGAFVQTAPFEYANGVARSGTQWSSINFDSSNVVRTGTTTHGKQVGVNWCIKATSGINENQADNVLNILQPVDVVALNNVHSVTSNAVAQKFNNYAQTKVLNEWHVLCRHGQKTYIHRDVNTGGDNPKWIKLIVYFHSSYDTATAISEYIVRLNYTPYRNTDYRGLTYKLIAGIEANNTDYDVLANQFGSLGWDSDGIYITNNSSFADFSTTVISLYDRTA